MERNEITITDQIGIDQLPDFLGGTLKYIDQRKYVSNEEFYSKFYNMTNGEIKEMIQSVEKFLRHV